MKIILITILIAIGSSFPRVALAKDDPMKINAIIAAEDIASSATQLLIQGDNLCHDQLEVDLPSFPYSFALINCSSFVDFDLITADLNLILDAGNYLLVVNKLNGKSEKSKKSDKSEKSDKVNERDSVGFSFTIGAVGLQGEQGEMGLVGAVGPQGEKGDTGTAGPQGEKGDTGLAGPIGNIGPQGIQGETGPRGFNGAIGLTGAQGIQGETGLQGLNGATGLTGPQGIQGDKGDAGAPGVAASHQYTIETSPWQGCGLPDSIDFTDPFAYVTWVAEIGYAQCEAFAHCPTGLQVIGGGLEIDGRDPLEALNSFPAGNISWLASVRYHAPIFFNDYLAGNYQFRAYAICADLTP